MYQPLTSCLRILLVIFAPLLVAIGWGEWVVASRAQTKDPIQSIRQHYAAINKRVGRYKKVKKELSGFSTEGGELIAYFEGPAVMKIAAAYYGESGRAGEEYYYQDGKLIFVYRKDSTYDKPLSGKVVKTEENRFYFENSRLIKWINENGKEVSPGGSEYKNKQVQRILQSKPRYSAPTKVARFRTTRAVSWNRTLSGWYPATHSPNEFPKSVYSSFTTPWGIRRSEPRTKYEDQVSSTHSRRHLPSGISRAAVRSSTRAAGAAD